MAGVLRSADVGAIQGLNVFDIRNGDVSSATSLITKAAIGTAYKWRPVANLPTNLALKYTDMFIKSAAHTLRTNAPGDTTDELRRKLAIVLGTARATMTAYWTLADTDIIPGEMLPAVITYVAPVGDATEPTWLVDNTLSDDHKAAITAELVLTEEEKGFMSDLVRCSVGIPAIQGASLMATGHHYLSDAKEKSRALFDVIEKQFWKKEPLKTWIDPDADRIRDALWHKAGHPINMTIKYLAAVNPKVPAMLITAHSGSAASRLPAKEAPLKGAETIRTLLINVRPFFEALGEETDYDILSEAIAVANCYVPQTVGGAGTINTIGGVDPAAVKTSLTPEGIENREVAIKWIEEVVARNADMIAIALGFFEALVESPTAGGMDRNDVTLLQANSLQKFKNQCVASFIMGKEYFADYASMKARKRSAGEYQPIRLRLR